MYADNNTNCAFDSLDEGMASVIVRDVSHPIVFGITDQDGNYTIRTDSGVFQVQQVVPAQSGLLIQQLCPPSAHFVAFDTLGLDTTGLDFAK